MVKNKAAPPKSLFHVVTWIEKIDILYNRTISTLSLVNNWVGLTILAVNYMGIQFRYIMCVMSLSSS